MKKKVKSKIFHYNFFPKNRRGQFYLVAAILIIAVIIGLNSISNYISSNEEGRLEDVKTELQIEGARVIEYDYLNGANEFENFARDYSEYVGEDIAIYYIVGYSGGMEAYTYVNGVKNDVSVTETNGVVSLTIDEVNYEFELNSGKNFYFVISQNIGGENYVVTN